MNISIPEPILERPALIGDVVAAIAELIKKGHIYIDDSLLEHYISPWLENQKNILGSAIYGFNNILRLVLLQNHLNKQSQIIIEISAEDPVWTENTHKLIFSYKIIQFNEIDNTINLIETVSSEIAGLLIPFAGILSTYIIKKASQSFGLSKFKALLEIDVEGITLKDGKIDVDLDILKSTKELLWYAPSIIKENIGISRLLGLDKIKLGDLLLLKKILIDRSGIYLETDLPKETKLLLEMLQEAYSSDLSLGKSVKNIWSNIWK